MVSGGEADVGAGRHIRRDADRNKNVERTSRVPHGQSTTAVIRDEARVTCHITVARAGSVP